METQIHLLPDEQEQARWLQALSLRRNLRQSSFNDLVNDHSLRLTISEGRDAWLGGLSHMMRQYPVCYTSGVPLEHFGRRRRWKTSGFLGGFFYESNVQVSDSCSTITC